MLIGFIAAAILATTTPPSGTSVLLPTSRALEIAERVVRAEGYDLSRRDRYFFDLIPGKAGGSFLSGYVTFGFYWNGDTASTISINERTGLTVDPVACVIFDYPSVRADRRAFRINGAPTALISDLKTQSGCDEFKTLRTPTSARIRRH